MRKAIFAIMCAGCLLGCVRVESNMLDNRTVVISGRGTAFNNSGDVERAVLQKAATEAQAAGYPYFSIFNSEDESRHGVVYVPGTTYSNGFATANCTGGFCSGNYSSTTTTTPGSAFGIVKPGVDIYVRFYREGEINPQAPGVWTVASILAVSGQGAVATAPLPQPTSPGPKADPPPSASSSAVPAQGIKNQDLMP